MIVINTITTEINSGLPVFSQHRVTNLSCYGTESMIRASVINLASFPGT